MLKPVLLNSLVRLLLFIIILDIHGESSIEGCPDKDWVTLLHHEFCVVRGSSVVFPCTLTSPAGHTLTEVFWLINAVKGVEPTDVTKSPSYAGRVEYFWDKNKNENNCGMRLSDVKTTDSAEYRVRIISDKSKWQSCHITKLSVTDLTVWAPEPVTEGIEVMLSCETTCKLRDEQTVIWRKNGEDLPVTQTHNSELLLQRVSTKDEGYYSCALEGHEEHPSRTVKLSVMSSPKKTFVSVKNDVITKGSSVTLICSSDDNLPIENYTWFKVGESTSVGSGLLYNITSIRLEDGGQYYCEARNKYGAKNSTAVSITVMGSCRQRSAVFVYAGLILGVTLTLGFKYWRKRTRISGSNSSNSNDNTQDYTNYVSNPRGRNPGAIQMSLVYQSLNPKTMQHDDFYQTLSPAPGQHDEFHQTLNPNTRHN